MVKRQLLPARQRLQLRVEQTEAALSRALDELAVATAEYDAAKLALAGFDAMRDARMAAEDERQAAAPGLLRAERARRAPRYLSMSASAVRRRTQAAAARRQHLDALYAEWFPGWRLDDATDGRDGQSADEISRFRAESGPASSSRGTAGGTDQAAILLPAADQLAGG